MHACGDAGGGGFAAFAQQPAGMGGGGGGFAAFANQQGGGFASFAGMGGGGGMPSPAAPASSNADLWKPRK